MTSSRFDDVVDAIITFVMFRGEVLAFFRATKIKDEKAWEKENTRVDYRGNILQACYAHTGQHGEASVSLLRNCRRANRKEYEPLLKEMEQIGYRITVHQKGRLRLK